MTNVNIVTEHGKRQNVASVRPQVRACTCTHWHSHRLSAWLPTSSWISAEMRVFCVKTEEETLFITAPLPPPCSPRGSAPHISSRSVFTHARTFCLITLLQPTRKLQEEEEGKQPGDLVFTLTLASSTTSILGRWNFPNWTVFRPNVVRCGRTSRPHSALIGCSRVLPPWGQEGGMEGWGGWDWFSWQTCIQMSF